MEASGGAPLIVMPKVKGVGGSSSLLCRSAALVFDHSKKITLLGEGF